MLKEGGIGLTEPPVDFQAMLGEVRRILATPEGGSNSEIVSRAPAFMKVLRQLDMAASTVAPVVLYGESGTGKELLARRLHLASRRAASPYVCINCAALPEPLLESELFGHEKGAFTGAEATRKGRFKLADGGIVMETEQVDRLDRFRILNLTVPSLASRENLRQANMELYNVRVERIKSAAELAAGVAHEINNPLCVIRNYVELLKRQPHSPEALGRLDKIGTELDWIVEIVGGMLAFAKPGDVPYREFDLSAILREAMLLTNHRFAEKGVCLESAVPSGRIPVMGNENRLKQLFVNLFANAADACSGFADARVVVEAAGSDQNGYVEAVVSDNGPGIPESAKDQIFNPFFTTKTGRHNTGLGLAICQQITDAHNGLLLFERADGWTRFIVRFSTC